MHDENLARQFDENMKSKNLYSDLKNLGFKTKVSLAVYLS